MITKRIEKGIVYGRSLNCSEWTENISDDMAVEAIEYMRTEVAPEN